VRHGLACDIKRTVVVALIAYPSIRRRRATHRLFPQEHTPRRERSAPTFL
jgi:hypothetical protein